MADSESQSLTKSFSEAPARLPGDPEHQIGGKVLKARRARVLKGSEDIFPSVHTSESLKLAGIGRLNAYRKAVDAEPAKEGEVFPVRRCGVALRGDLGVLTNAEGVVQSIKDPLKLIGGKQSRCASSEIDRVDRVAASHLAGFLYLKAKDRDIVVLHRGMHPRK